MGGHIAEGVAISLRRLVVVAVVLATATLCTVAALTAITGPMNGMNTAMDGSRVVASATQAAATSRAVDLASKTGPAMASMCDSACFGESAGACALNVGLVVVTGMLLLGSRRDTFLGLLARVSLVRRRRRWARDPWQVLSLTALGVLRI